MTDQAIAKIFPQKGRIKPLEFVARRGTVVLLKDTDDEIVEVTDDLYRSLISQGLAKAPDHSERLNFIPDEADRLKREMILHAIKRENELRSNGHTATRALEILRLELVSHERFQRLVPTKLSARTLQLWKSKHKRSGKAGLIPRTQERGNRTIRYDELFEDIAWTVLEDLYLRSDRVSIGRLAELVEVRYRDACEEKGISPGPCGKRCLESVVNALRTDDIIKARHDTETSRKLRLQAQFYHRVKLPFDLVEIDTTTADVFIIGADGGCAGRPTVSIAIDCATGWPLALRLTLENATEALTVQALKDVMTDRGAAFFEYYEIENRIEVTGTPQIVSVDQGAENSGPHLSSIVGNTGMEWASNVPGAPEKKPHVERFIRELNGFLHTLPGATTSKDLPDKKRIDKGMLEASLTLQELQAAVYKWAYDCYALKLRRLIHSPLRQAESPTESWNGLKQKAVLPPAPDDIRDFFNVRKKGCKLQHYGIEVEGIQYHSDELRDLIGEVGRGDTVDVMYDPLDIREIRIAHPRLPAPITASAKTEGVAAVSFAEVKRAKKPGREAKRTDKGARATAANLAVAAQKTAESLGRGKITSLKNAKAKEKLRQRRQEITQNSKKPVGNTSDLPETKTPSPKLSVPKRGNRSEIVSKEK
ncbi:Mu transposase C-terminal domain-containing protein [Roseibium sp.]|uniref:Mu transposase C-terminal domain-containing protein n=1 Tax=Roseibium sp. TaxID=1936156 RepID=UPI0039EEB6B0